ncbi:MAG: baseplate J/gp47 family protein [Patescibacteria group bacterium]|nr:baseplate J/gp47 family protein [Patescibacteria group bacterium]
MLDYIGQMLDTPRLSAVGALCTLQFTLANALSQSYTIPANTQVGTTDGQLIFQTTAALTIAAGQTTGTVSAQCTTAGTVGNGYAVNQVTVLIQPNTLIGSVTNTTVTASGSEVETDDHYRSRIQLAPNQFSTAGPTGAYKYYAMSANSSVIDAQVTSPAPGSVSVNILTGPILTQPVAAPNSSGIASSALILSVLDALSANNVRPLTDTVNVYPVVEVDYQITGTVTTYADADITSTMAAANTAAVSLALDLANQIERDLVPSQWVASISVAGVYEATITIAANIYSSGSWQANNVYAIGTVIVDSNGHVQEVTAVTSDAKSGGSAPAWATSVGNTTTDNHVTWTMIATSTTITPQGDGRVLLSTGQWPNCTSISLTQVTGTELENG